MIKICRLVTTREYSEFRDLVILLESSFAQVTRKGKGIKQVHLGITPDHLIIASDNAIDISVGSPSFDENNAAYFAECLELESIIPLEWLNISIHSHRFCRLRVRFCNGSVRYYELSEFTQTEAKWRSWCDRLAFLNCDLSSSSSDSQTSLTDFTMATQKEKEIVRAQKDGKRMNNCVCVAPKHRVMKAKIHQQRQVQGLLDDSEDECMEQVGVAISPTLLETLFGQRSSSDERDTPKSQLDAKFGETTLKGSSPKDQKPQQTIARFASGVNERCENRLTLGEFTLPRGYNINNMESRGDQLPFGRVSPSPFHGIGSNPLCALSPFQSLDNVLRRLDPDWYKPTSLPANKWCGADIANTDKRRLKTPKEMVPCLSKGGSECNENKPLQHRAERSCRQNNDMRFADTRFTCGSEVGSRPEVTKVQLSQNVVLSPNPPDIEQHPQHERPIETAKDWHPHQRRPTETVKLAQNFVLSPNPPNNDRRPQHHRPTETGKLSPKFVLSPNPPAKDLHQHPDRPTETVKLSQNFVLSPNPPAKDWHQHPDRKTETVKLSQNFVLSPNPPAKDWHQHPGRPTETAKLSSKSVLPPNPPAEEMSPCQDHSIKTPKLSQNFVLSPNPPANDQRPYQDRTNETEKLQDFWKQCDEKTNLPFTRPSGVASKSNLYGNRIASAAICEKTRAASRKSTPARLLDHFKQKEDLLGSHLHLASERYLFGPTRNTTKLGLPMQQSLVNDQKLVRTPLESKSFGIPSKVLTGNGKLAIPSNDGEQSTSPKNVPPYRIPPVDEHHVPTDLKHVCNFDSVLPTPLTPLAERLPCMVSQLPCPLTKLILSPPLNLMSQRRRVEPIGMPKKLTCQSALAYNAEWLTGRGRRVKQSTKFPCIPRGEYLTEEFIEMADRCVVKWEMEIHNKLVTRPELVMPYADTLCCLLELRRTNPLCRIRRVRSDPCISHKYDQSHGGDLLPISKEKLLRTFSICVFSLGTEGKDVRDGTKKNVFPASYESVRHGQINFWFLPLPLSLCPDDFDPIEKQCIVKKNQRLTVRAYLECLESHCYPPTTEDMLHVCAMQKCLLLPAANPLCDGQGFAGHQDNTKKSFTAKIKSVLKSQRRKWWLRRHHSFIAFKVNIEHPKLHQDTNAIGTPNSKLLEFRSRELACELTLIDKELLCRVPDHEIVALGCGRRVSIVTYLHIKMLVAWHDRIVNLFTSEILAYISPQARAQAVIKCLKIIQYMTEVSSYQSSRAILCALQSIPIYRLKKTWWILCEQFPKYFKKFCSMSAFYVDVCSCSLMSQPGRQPPYLPFYGELFCILLGDLGDIDVQYKTERPGFWVDDISNPKISSSTVHIKTIIRKKLKGRSACTAHQDVYVNFNNLAAIGRVKRRPMDIHSVAGRRRLSKVANPPDNSLDVFHHFQESAYFYSFPSNTEARNYLLKQPFSPPHFCYTQSKKKEMAKEVYPIVRRRSGIY